MIVGVAKETAQGESRVALVPAVAAALRKAGHEVRVEAGCGDAAGFPDEAFHEQDVQVTPRDQALAADVLLAVQVGCTQETGLGELRKDQAVIGFCDPLGSPQAMQDVAGTGCTLISMELIPRITRAQSMDALSSMATVAGYRAVLLAAEALPKMFPMMMTAAGTITPARVFIVGAGVAGLQAIATARRLGAVVEAFDVRPVVKEQVESLGAKFLEIDLGAEDAQDKGGYAKELGEEQLRLQRELMTRAVAENDVVITTAAIPGKKAPVLVNEEMAAQMRPGSVLVDLAAERGGNCALTRPGETVESNGVKILGPLNLPSTAPYHASQMYAKNISTLLLHLAGDGEMKWDMEDEITRETVVTRGGEVLHPRVRELLSLEPLERPAAQDEGERPA